MTKSKQLELQLTRVKGRRVRVDFKGGEVTSDAGLLLIREVDRQLGLTERAARQLVDKRQKGKVRHEVCWGCCGSAFTGWWRAMRI